MKQFVKVLDRSGSCFQYLSIKFLILSEAKVKEGIFDGPQIQNFMKDVAFTNTMNNIECQEWNAFIEVVKNFLGDVKDPHYIETVKNMWRNWEYMDVTWVWRYTYCIHILITS